MTTTFSITPSRLVNFRDLGGLRVRGGAIREGLLWRSDDVSTVDRDQAAELVQSGLGSVIDLRSPSEVSFTGRGPLQSHTVRYHALPLTQSVAVPAVLQPRLRGELATPQQVGEWYATVLVTHAGPIVEGLAFMASSAGATLFHCAAGKDRTGVFAAAVLTVLGAADDVIIRDYAVTQDALAAIMQRIRAQMSVLMGADAADELPVGSAMMDAAPASMAAMIDTVNVRHGGILRVLSDAGLDANLVSALRDKLVTEIPPHGHR